MSVQGEGSSAQETESVHKLGPDGQQEPDSGPLIGPGGETLSGPHAVEDGEPEGYDIKPPEQGQGQGTPENATHALTAFIVYLTPEGNWVATADTEIDLMIERPAHFNDFAAAGAILQKDVQVQQIVQNVIGNFMSLGQQMQQQMESARIAEAAGLGPNRQMRRHPGTR